MNYNLVDEPWIDCTFLDGSEKSVGFREFFLRAHEIRTFHTDPPLVEAPLMKILLAIGHRILDGPENKKAWKAAYEKGRYDESSINAYFEKWLDRFDLFHPEYPFMQNGGLNRQRNQSREPIEPPSISIVLPHRTSGNNVTLFDHTTDNKPLRLTPREAVYALLFGNNFLLSGTFKKGSDLCGWQGNCSHAPMVNGYHVFVMGNSLFETLLLNTLTPQHLGPLFSRKYGWGIPAWERQKATRCDKRMPEGYLDYLTFRGRNIRLLESEGVVDHILIACGDSYEEFFKEPFVPTRTDKKGEKALNLSLERLFWRDSDTLFRYDERGFAISPLAQLLNISNKKISNRKIRRHYNLLAYGSIVNKNPLYHLLYVKESLPVPLPLLENVVPRKTLEEGLALCEDGNRTLKFAIKRFADHLDMEPGGVRSKAEALYWQLLDTPFRKFLTNIDQKEALEQWREIVIQAMKEAYRKATMGIMTDKARGIEAIALGERSLYLKERRSV